MAFGKELLLLNNPQDLHQKLEQWFGLKAKEVGRETSSFGTSQWLQCARGQEILLDQCNGFVRSPKAMATLQAAGSVEHSVNSLQWSGKRFDDAQWVLAVPGQHCTSA